MHDDCKRRRGLARHDMCKNCVYADCSNSCYAGSTLNYILFDEYCDIATNLLLSDTLECKKDFYLWISLDLSFQALFYGTTFTIYIIHYERLIGLLDSLMSRHITITYELLFFPNIPNARIYTYPLNPPFDEWYTTWNFHLRAILSKQQMQYWSVFGSRHVIPSKHFPSIFWSQRIL